MLKIYRNKSIEWRPSPVVALATSIDKLQVAAAREDGSIEIWLVSPGSTGWHCQLIIQGNPDSRISSLVWCRSRSKSTGLGRLFSSSIDGSVSEWDLFSLKQKIVLDSIGVSIWQMAMEPFDEALYSMKHDSELVVNGYSNHSSTARDDSETSESEDDDDNNSAELHIVPINSENSRIAFGCDDGCVRIYAISDSDGLTYARTFLRVSGRILSVAWSLDGKLIFSGSSDGFIRCWDSQSSREVYRITVGAGGLGGGSELCVWSLLVLRCGTLVSGDSTGNVNFWDSRRGTHFQTESFHKGDVNSLATVPNHNRVFSAGSDGQVILYKLCSDAHGSSDQNSSTVVKKWVYVGYIRAHTHDVRALTVAVPISREDPLPNEKVTRSRHQKEPGSSSYHKWAHLGIPMLISAGDDTKLFAYSAKEFTKFAPHDICPAPQRVPIQLVLNTIINKEPLMLVQCSDWLDVVSVKPSCDSNPMRHGRSVATRLLARVKSRASRKIICSTMSGTGALLAYSDHLKPSLFEIRPEVGRNGCKISKRQLPRSLPFAHSMAFSADSTYFMVAGHDRKIYVIDVERAELLHTFIPCRKEDDMNLPPSEPPITRMFTSSDGQWLAAINCFGDIYIFNLEIHRQHWFISRLNGASVTAGSFLPGNSNVLVITTSTNQVYVFDVEAKQLSEWSRRHTFVLPRRFQEFPGEVIGLSFPPCASAASVIVYSSRAMCFIDFKTPVAKDDDDDSPSCLDSSPHKVNGPTRNGNVKRKWEDSNKKQDFTGKKNFDFSSFKDPVLFVGHLSEDSLLILDKPWLEVVQSFGPPVHRHIYGT